MSSQITREWGFAILPTELRLMIYFYTLLGPRALNFLNRTLEWKSEDDEDPIALRICYESRELALKYYSPRNNLGELGSKYIDQWQLQRL
jgi:hypothetical protein